MKFKFLALVFLLAACSVQQDRVTSQPPNFNTAASLGTEYGKMSVEGFSAFIWPAKATDAESVALYKEVAENAAASDALELRRQALSAQLDAQAASMDYAPCFKNFERACVDVSTPDKQAACDSVTLDNDLVQNWLYNSVSEIPADQPNAEEMKKLFVACKSFTDTKLSIKAELSDITARANDLTAKILYAIDPDYKATGIQTNYKSLKNPATSSLTIIQSSSGDQAIVSLDGFVDDDNYQTSLDGKTTYKGQPQPQAKIFDVEYSHKNRTLNFKVPEFKNGVATGGVYSFILERNNFGQNPRFSGDLNYTDADGKLHHGSAKIDAKFRDDLVSR